MMTTAPTGLLTPSLPIRRRSEASGGTASGIVTRIVRGAVDGTTRLTTAQSILERVAAGDTAAVSECLDRYGDLVWSLARRYLRNAADAEDAVQDIFIDIWGSSARYDRNIASEVAFISTIARRRLIDKIRSAGRRPLMDSLDDDEGAPIDPGVAATVEDDTEVSIVERVLAKMDPEHQKVLSMSLYEGYSHSEIAGLLSLPLGTVKTRVRRGLIHIREQLKITAPTDSTGELPG